MKTNTVFSGADHKINILNTVREKYPKATPVVVAAFGISHKYYKDDTMSEAVAETIYTKIPDKYSFIGVKLEFVWL